MTIGSTGLSFRDRPVFVEKTRQITRVFRIEKGRDIWYSMLQKFRLEVTGYLEMRKLLIADSGEEFRLALSELVRGNYRVRVCNEGKETLDMLLAFKPDLLVLDMMLPGLDGVGILERAALAGVRPTVLAITKHASDYMVLSADRLGVSYMMVKPCDVKSTAARLQDLTEHLQAPAVALPEPRTAVTNILLALGISTKLRGYAYLREAILEMASRPGQSVTKELYPTVGRLCDASGTQVERSIRSAIAKAWEQRDEVMWRLYFQQDAARPLERPTNAQFITCIADRIKTVQNV